MDEYLCFENAVFCTSNCNFFRFSAHNLFLILLLNFYSFMKFCDPYCERKLRPHCTVDKIPTPILKFNVV